MARKKKKQQKPWQYKFTLGLVAVTCILILAFFAQSSQTVREATPVAIALERLQSGKSETGTGN